MDPMQALRYKSMLDKFQSRHVKFLNFIHDMSRKGLPQGSVVEIQVKTPDGNEYVSNFKVQPEDEELFETIKNLTQK